MTSKDLHVQALEELRTYIARCDRILNVLAGKQSMNVSECEIVRELYVALKRDLKAESARGTLLPRSQRDTVLSVDSIYGSAVRHASIELTPKTSTHPLRGRWEAAISSCKIELLYYLEHLPMETC